MTTKVLRKTGRHIDTKRKGGRHVFMYIGPASSSSEPPDSTPCQCGKERYCRTISAQRPASAPTAYPM